MSRGPERPQVAGGNGAAPNAWGAGDPAPEAPARLFFDHTSLRVSAAAMAVVLTFYPVLSFAQSVPAGVTRIVPDGRTATTVTTNGSISTVTTGTISGPNAFNSFSQFQIGAGNTGNLILPNGTSNLINLVTGSTPTTINGTLNAYKNGQIGGNVYFADPNGFIVGSSGVVNVGALNVTTPSREFVNSVIGASGQINQSAVNNLLAGTVPLSPDGNIRIRGRINAVDAVRLTGQNVFVGGRDQASRDQAYRFGSTVNSSGLRSGNKIVVRNGSIQIVAANDAKINGGLAARRGGTVKVQAGNDVTIGAKGKITVSNKDGPAGSIAVNAGHDIKISGYGTLSAKSLAGNAGTIRVIAERNLVIEAGATFDASAVQGNGGLVELSAFGRLNIPSGVKVNVSAPNGSAGYLLIDPPTMTISNDPLSIGGAGAYSNTDVAGWINSIDAGGTLILCAGSGGGNCNGTFTLASDGVIDARRTGGGVVNVSISASAINIAGTIDTRLYAGARLDALLSASSTLSTGNSGSVALDAASISVTGKIFAEANGAATGGAVTLIANAIDHQSRLASSANTSITIGGTITGSQIIATAVSDASTVIGPSGMDGMLQFGAGTVLGMLSGVNGGYVKSESSAKVTVQGTASLTASGAITLMSVGSETAQDPALVYSLGVLQNAVGASVVVGVVNADIATRIQSGATISAGGDLKVLAANNADLAVSALVFSVTTSMEGSLAYSTGTVNTKALIDPGVIISKAGNVSVVAQNQNTFSTTAVSLAGGTGTAAFAAAISDVHNNAVANLGASIGSGAATNAVTVYSGSNTVKNAVSASSTVGSPYLIRNITAAAGGTPFAAVFGQGGAFDSTRLFSSTIQQGTTATMRVGLTLALNQSSLTSSASIAAIAPDSGGNMVASGVAPSIVATGGVGVVSQLSDRGIRGAASSSIESNPVGTAADPTTQNGVSMAVNVTEITQSSNAFIGSGVSINAANIGVRADAEAPITITWNTWDSFASVTSHFNGNLGIVNNILTTYANATSETASTGFAGAVNYYNLITNTTAWVGSGATLTQTAGACTSATPTCWSSAPSLSVALPAGLPTDNLDWFNRSLTWFGSPGTIAWTNNLQVVATSSISSINIGGNFSWLTVFGTNSSSSTGTAIGGSANVNIFETSTVAGIGAGARVSATGNLEVNAATNDLIYAVAPTSGKGSGLGLNGIVSVLQLDNVTSASISNLAQITAPSVSVTAQQNISSFDVAGGVGYSKATGVGIAVAVASMSADTSAYIGDNSQALAATGATADDANLAPAVTGSIDAFRTNVAALTVGRLTTVAVAAQFANNAIDPTEPPAVQATAPPDAGMLDKAALFFKNGFLAIGQKIETAYNNLGANAAGPVRNSTVATGAGSAAVDLTSMNTNASIAGATIKYDVGGNNQVSVQALNNTIIDTASGSAALSKGAPGTENTVGIAGAVAVTISSDMTRATISSSTIKANNTAVWALAGGESTTLGLAVALTAGSGNGTQVSVSASVAEISNGVQAGIDSSTIDKATGGSATVGDVSIIADQKTNIGIGAGALYAGFGSGSNNGFGISLTYASIIDPSSGAAVQALLTNSHILNTRNLSVEALNTSRIVSAAATAGGGEGASGFAGSIVVNDISPTMLAKITSIPVVNGTTTVVGGITVSGDVVVLASGGSIAALDTIISNAVLASNNGVGTTSNSGVDFSGAAVSAESATGAAILAIAGSVQFGASNIGVSLVVNRIRTRHEALIDRASVTSTGGVVSVSAIDNAEILGVAFGGGASNGSMAGNGSVVYNAINNRVVAQIGHGIDATDAANAATATVDAAAVSVTAQASGTIRGAAGAISINIAGGNAVGLSAVVGQIGTRVSAAILGATVTADNALSNASPLLNNSLQAGSVVVIGSADAKILAVAIGVAMSIGGAQQSTAPQQNLAETIASMAAPPGGTPPPTPPAQPSNGMSGAGSLVLSTESTGASSTIADGGNSRGASVTANNNVLVLAANSDTISAYSGALSVSANSGAGIGASVVVNTIDGTTSAKIANSTVDAHATGSAATIDSGTLANAVDPTYAYTPATTPALSNGTTTIKGIAVVSTSEQSADTVAAVLSVSSHSTAVSANAITNIMSGTTEAKVSSSDLNTNLAAGQVSAVRVTASSASYSNNLDLGMAISGQGPAGTAALVINKMNRATNAEVDSTDIGSTTVAAGTVSVIANAFQGTAAQVIGVAVSGSANGVAGSALTNLFESSTNATLNHGTVYASSLAVQAFGRNGFFGAVGAAAFGNTTGAGATVLVMMSSNSVTARVGDRNANTAATNLNLSGPLTINASNETDTSSYAVVGTFGGNAAISAQFSGMFISNNVSAELDNTTTIVTGSAANGTVTVSAQEIDSIAPVVGGLTAGGTGGVGAAVNLVVLKSNTAAQIAGGAVTTPGAVNVSAVSTRHVNPVTVTASIAGQVALAATVSVVLIGSGASADQMSVLNAGATSGDSNSGTLGNAGAATGTNVVDQVEGGIDGISAQILTANVTASAITVSAIAQTAVKNIAGALALGSGAAGIGAGVGLTTVDQRVTAKTSGGTLTAPVITVRAVARDASGGHTAETLGIAGAGGFYVGLGAAVADSRVDNTVLAELGSRALSGGTNTGTIIVEATDSSSLVSEGYGVAIAIGGAVGISLGYTEKSSAITARIAASTTITNFAAVMVIAAGGGSLTSETIAGAAGIGSGAGAKTTATDDETVVAQIGANSSISAVGAGVLVSATAAPDVATSSIGVAAGAVGVGASIAISNASVQVTSNVGDNTTIAGSGLTVTAATMVASSGHSANAVAVGSGGGLLMGLQATYAQAANTSAVTAYGGKNLTLPSANVTIAAQNDTNQYAKGTGIANGYIGAGSTTAQTSSLTTTTAYLDEGAVTTTTNHGVLSISATGSDSNTADALAGSGGMVAGAAATATTSTDSTLSATLKGGTTTNTLYFGGLGISAQHTTIYAANGDAYQASSAGASGGTAINTVESNVTAAAGANLIVNSAGGNMNVIASDSVNQTTGGARAGSGGVAAGAATVSDATVTQNVAANIGADTIFSLNDNPATSTALINIEAYSFLNTVDRVSLVAGGLFAGGGARSTMNATANNSVDIADGVHLFSAGNIAIGTAARMTARNNASASLSGLVTGAGASTSSTQNAHQTVTVGEATIEAWGLLSIYAGQSGDGSYTTDVSSNGTTVVYNYALIPVSAQYYGKAIANSYSTLTLGNGSRVLGANNVFIGATPGATAANGSGTNYNPYLAIFSTANYDNRGETPITTGDVVLDGIVAAGIHNQQVITISYGGVVSLSSGGSPYGLTLEQVGSTSGFSSVMSYNHQKIQYTLLGAFNPKQDVYNQIASLSGLTVAQVTAAVANGQTISALNDDAAGTKQRQIATYIQQLPYMADQTGAAYAFGDILASAGNVSILANTVTGHIVSGVTPSVSARDSALISIDNQGIRFLFTSALALSGVSGGRVTFTGAATENNIVSSATQGVVITRDLTSQTPTISLTASYSATNINRDPIDQQGNVLATTPDIYFGGVVTNVNGLLNVTNQLGNVMITRDIRAGTVVMTVPNGVIGGNLGANSIYNFNGDVAGQWGSVEYRPTDVLTAVYAAATYIGIYGSANGGAAIGGNWDMHAYSYYTNQQQWTGNYSPVTNIADVNTRNAVFTARMLASYYDGASNGHPSLYSWIFLPTGEGVTPSSGGTASSWVRWQFENQAYLNTNNNGGPFNYANGGNFFQVVQIQSQVVNGVQSQGISGATASTISAGKALILSAAAININGNIVVGQSSNYSVDIGGLAANRIQAIKNDASLLANARNAAAAGNYADLSDYVSVVNGSDVKVKASYNALTDQILLNPVVQGVGGYVYLNGKILSTSTSGGAMGNITVRGGAGTVTVNNSTGTDLVTNVINTGVSAASVVQLVDHARNLTTWYVYNAGAPANQQVTRYEVAGVTAGSYAGLTGVASANSGLSYLTADQLYRWADTASLSRAATSDMKVFGWTFDNIVSANSPVYPYARSGPQILNGTQANNFEETITATGSATEYRVTTGSGRCCGTDFDGTWYQERYDHLTLTMTNTVKANFPISINFTGGGTSNINVTSTASIIVNASINNLQGNTTISATGANSKIVAGAEAFVSGVSVALRGEGGVGSLARPMPIATYGGTLTATSTDRDIAVAAVGALRIAGVKTNNPSASVLHPAGAGNVQIAATGDITSSTPYNVGTPIIVGKSITINTSGGAIGAVSSVDGDGQSVLTNINPIVIQASAALLSNGTYDGGLLNSSSSTGTYLVQSTGDLRVGAVTSNGPVFLAAAGADGHAANILNGVTTGGLTTAQTAYLADVWTQLELMGNGSGVPASVTAYQSMIKGAYNDYWQLRNIAFADGATYNISTLGAQMIAAQLAAKRGVAVGQISTDDIRDEAMFRFAKAEYLLGITATKVAATLGIAVENVTRAQIGAAVTASLPALDQNAPPQDPLDRLFGTTAGQTGAFTWAVQTAPLTAALTTYNAAYDYALPQDSALYAKLSSGSQWTLNQLTYTVSAGANPENNVPAPSIATLPLNVRGRQVMLYAPNGNIGSLATPETFTFRSDDASNLSSAQKALLASAGPGQLTVTTSNVAGTNGQVQQYTVSVAQQSLLIVSPLGLVSALANSQIYLGSQANLSLGGIPLAVYGPMTAAYSAGIQTVQPGNVRLQAVGSILGGVANQVAISGNIANLTLIAETGSIGQATTGDPASNPNALLLALTGATGQLDQAQATQGIYIRQTAGDLILGNINAGSGQNSVLQLGATGSIYAEAQFTDRNAVHIVARELDLRAGDSIGFNQAAFQPLQVHISGAISGSAPGAITLLSPTAGMTVGRAGSYGTLTAGGTLTLNTAGDLTIGANVTAQGALSLLANGAVTFAAGTSAAPTVASSITSGVTVISGTLSMAAYTDIVAAGPISVTTTGDATLGRLTSAQAFGTAGNAIVVTTGGPLTLGGIFNNGDGRDTIETTGLNAGVLLTASGDIGSQTGRLLLDTPVAAVRSTRGDVYLATARALHLTSGVADLGAFDLTGGAGLTLDTLTGGTRLNILSTAGAIDIGTATSGGTQTIRAATNTNFTTLTTTGITGDAGDVGVTADTGAIQGTTVAANGSATLAAATTNKGTTLTATNGSIGLNAAGLIDWTTLDAGTQINVRSTAGAVALGAATSGGSQTIRAAQDVNFTTLTTTGITGNAGNVDVTSDTGLIQGVTVSANGSATLTAATTNKGTMLTATNGSIGLNAAGLIDWATLNAGATIGVRSTAGAVALGAATSGGTQTIRAAQDVNFAMLTTTGIAGDVDVTSDTGLIQGITVAANRSATLTAATTNKGTTLTATNGSIGLTAAGLIDWTTLNAGTTINIRSTGADVALGTATSGGTQTIRAAQDVNFAMLTTTGIAGDVDVTSDTGLIQGITVAANRSATLTAATTNKGTSLTAATGSATLLAGGLIDWTNINVARSFTATSTGGAINLGTVVSGGSQTLHAFDGVTFTRLTTTGVPGDQGDVSVISDRGSIHGATVAANGDASFDAGVSIDLDTLHGGSVALSTPRDLNVGYLTVYRAMSLAADTINVTAEQLQSVPPVPLHVIITGYGGAVATSANVTIDPPVVIVDRLSTTDIFLTVDSPGLTIDSGYVPGRMTLSTPGGDILLDNRSPVPSAGFNLQLYQPGGVFSMRQTGNANFTDTQVVYYDTTISSTITNFGGGAFTGYSLLRNIVQDMQGGEGFDFGSTDKSGLAAFYLLGLPGGWRIDAARTPLPVEAIGDGPAVNIEGLPGAKKPHQLRDRKGGRSPVRSTSLEQGGGVRLSLAAAAR